MKALSIKVIGKVQKVWYRQSALDEARLLNLKGYVMNLSDLNVYIEVEGPEDALEIFAKWCEKGPELARVERIEINQISEKGFNNFQIVY